MESKIIALFLVALIGGLGGGYALSYVTYQPQITDLRDTVKHLQEIIIPNLQDDLVNLDDRLETANSTLQNKLDTLNSNLLSLNSTVEMMGNTTDHEAYFIEGSGDVTTIHS